MANNRNSSSSSFINGMTGGSAAALKSPFKSNSQSTFDMFNVNVENTQKRVDKIFGYTKKQITNNEKSTLKSINKIFNAFDDRAHKSADTFNKSFSKAYEDMDAHAEKHADTFATKMINAINKVIASAKSKYSEMYRNLDQEHNNYVDKMQNKEQQLVGDLNEITGNSGIDTTTVAKDISNKLSKMELQCKCICDCGGKGKNEKESQGTKLLQKLSSDTADGNESQDKGISDALKIGGMILDTVKSLFDKFIGIFIDGAHEFHDQYQSSYNQLSTAFATDRKETHDIVSDGLDTLSDNMKGVVSYAQDFLPALEQVSKQGLMGDDALGKAIRDTVDKKIMPWLDTATEQYVNMNTYLSEANINALKGQQLMMQSSQNGNRLLQTGVINSLTSDIEPLLRDVEFNTGEKQIAGYEKLMESMVNQGFTEREAYDYARQLSQVQKDQFAALQSGDASQIVAASAFAEGGSVDDVMNRMSDTFGKMMGQAQNDIAVGAIKSGLGSMSMAGDTMTVGRADAFSKALSENSREQTSLAQKNNEDFLKEYKKAQKNAEEKVTTTQEATNKIKNTAAETLGLLSTQIPLFWTWAGTIVALLTGITKWGAGKLLGKLAGKLIGSRGSAGGLLGKIGGGLKAAGSTIGTGLAPGGLYAGGGATATAATAGIASGVAGAYMTYKDVKGGIAKSKEWLGSESTGSKISAGIGGALGGTGSGVGEKGASAKSVAKNTGKNALKGAAIGAAIGTVIPGAGTAIGGAIGAGVGALTGLIGGRRIAKATKSIGNAFKSLGMGIGNAVKKGAENFKQKLAIAKEAAKKIGSAIKDSAKTVAGAYTKMRKSVVSMASKGAKAVASAYSKISNGVTGAIKKGANNFKKKLSAAKNIGKGLNSALKSAGSVITSNLKSGAKVVKNKLKNSLAGKAVGFIKSKITGSHASGLDEVPYDGYIAKLHKGETVFNKTAAKTLKKVLGITGKSVGIPPIIRNIEALQKSGLKGSIFKSLMSIVGSHAAGISDAPDEVAKLHEGEVIVPKEMATVIQKSTGLMGTSVATADSPSLMDRYKKSQEPKEEKFNDDRIVRVLEESTIKIVKAITSSVKKDEDPIDKLKQIMNRSNNSYNKSIINMESLSES